MNETPEIPLSELEQGFTLIELLVATAMMIVITGAAVSMLVSVMHQQPEVTSKSDQIGEARSTMVKLVNELRQGAEVVPAGRSQLALSTYCAGSSTGQASPCSVAYSCSREGVTTPLRYQCTRAVEGGAPEVVATGLASDRVFCYTPITGSPEPGSPDPTCGESIGTPTYVGVRIELPASSGESKTVLEDGAALHNSPNYRGG
jgi:type II secretory pathway pseudopilin PulG